MKILVGHLVILISIFAMAASAAGKDALEVNKPINLTCAFSFNGQTHEETWRTDRNFYPQTGSWWAAYMVGYFEAYTVFGRQIKLSVHAVDGKTSGSNIELGIAGNPELSYFFYNEDPLNTPIATIVTEDGRSFSTKCHIDLL